MQFSDYQKQALKTALYPNRTNNLYYPTLGLTGEAGEVADKIKKVMRDDKGVLSEAVKEAIVKELGDVLWYVSALADEMKVSLEEIAQINLTKLAQRKAKNTLHGSGDNR